MKKKHVIERFTGVMRHKYHDQRDLTEFFHLMVIKLGVSFLYLLNFHKTIKSVWTGLTTRIKNDKF